MPAPLTLPRFSWGSPDAERRALLLHGLGSNGPLMWRFGIALADAGWLAVAVDLRGHGIAPRALDYTIDAYAADVATTAPDGAGPWDLVIGHSLGGAAATVAAAEHPDWTRRLILVDPAIRPTADDLRVVRESQEQAFADPSVEAVRAEHPHWHQHDVELKSLAARQASRWAVEQSAEQNDPWDVTTAAARLTVPTHVLASDPAVYSIFTGPLVDEVLANPVIGMSIVPSTGHSPHRDRPEATMDALAGILADPAE